MIARIILAGIVVIALAAGIALYYLQVHAFYDDVSDQIDEVALTSIATGAPEGILADNIRAIDSDSSPIRFRACFDTGLSLALLTETYEIYDDAVPRVAPNWLDCFDAEQIGADLETGKAVAFMGHENVTYGVDRVVAVYPDGRAYAWHQLNFCGEVVFDGDPVPDTCPTPPESPN